LLFIPSGRRDLTRPGPKGPVPGDTRQAEWRSPQAPRLTRDPLSPMRTVRGASYDTK